MHGWGEEAGDSKPSAVGHTQGQKDGGRGCGPHLCPFHHIFVFVAFLLICFCFPSSGREGVDRDGDWGYLAVGKEEKDNLLEPPPPRLPSPPLQGCEDGSGAGGVSRLHCGGSLLLASSGASLLWMWKWEIPTLTLSASALLGPNTFRRTSRNGRNGQQVVGPPGGCGRGGRAADGAVAGPFSLTPWSYPLTPSQSWEGNCSG